MSCNGCEVKFGDFHSENLYTWCTNCGNYAIAGALKRALVASETAPDKALMCFDIGCHGNGADKLTGYTFHGLHGRVLPFACGAAIANQNLKVIAFGGDGGTFSEGVNHLIHSVRNNYNITFILHNNSNYALTTGQASALTKQGQPKNSSPDGVFIEPIHAMHFVLNLKPSFAARTFSGNVKQMTEIFKAGINHKGFSFIEVLQNCPTFNKETPHEWYQQRVFDTLFVPEYNNRDLGQAMQISADLENHIATGILYQNPDLPDYKEMLPNRKDIATELIDEVRNYDISALANNFR